MLPASAATHISLGNGHHLFTLSATNTDSPMPAVEISPRADYSRVSRQLGAMVKSGLMRTEDYVFTMAKLREQGIGLAGANDNSWVSRVSASPNTSIER